MNRRALLKAIGGSATFGLAGCTTRRSSRGTEQNDTRPETATTDAGDTTTDTGTSVFTNRSFDVISTECGAGTNESSASFETARIRVTGTITGSDSCYTAKLKRATSKAGTLTVSIQSYKRENDGPCSMCLTDIKYDAVFEFKNEAPRRIVVLHNDTEVLNESRE
ncbi:hypothetical protein [Halocatena pleomorpha]|uniref:Uncharacterized protein n=1 Tax=Halocatena pleomorpha TaxID=1785090 RepID=A0A3P3RJR6_9EURY|nr:hypothetical protein [Halocatena pleomorpha]RRJ33751.1 hypothetical protein EIK79_02880 [Halocatena pleomorpha]